MTPRDLANDVIAVAYSLLNQTTSWQAEMGRLWVTLTDPPHSLKVVQYDRLTGESVLVTLGYRWGWQRWLLEGYWLRYLSKKSFSVVATAADDPNHAALDSSEPVSGGAVFSLGFDEPHSTPLL